MKLHKTYITKNNNLMKVAIPQEKVGSSYKSREPPREKAVNTKTNFLNCFTTTFKYFLNCL